MTLRTRPDKEYDKTRKELGHEGPYLPILLEACQEQEFSYEYRNGATSYGAYTFCMAQVLRESRGHGANLSFEQLSERVTEKLHRLKYNQTPNLVGAKERVTAELPWGAAKDAGAKGASVKGASAKRRKSRRKPAPKRRKR